MPYEGYMHSVSLSHFAIVGII